MKQTDLFAMPTGTVDRVMSSNSGHTLTGKQKKDEAVEQMMAKEENRKFVFAMRDVAVMICRRKGVVTADDLREYARGAQPPPSARQCVGSSVPRSIGTLCSGGVSNEQDDEPEGWGDSCLEVGGVMKVLVACEYSGVVRDALISMGHEAMSCDLLPTEADGPHYQGDVRDVIHYPWDMMIAHPPCTHLSVSGARHFEDKRKDGRQQSAVSFFLMLAKLDIPKIAIENPVCIMSTIWRKPDQIIQPWQFGHGETKATCLWLKGLPPLRPTNIVDGRESRIHKMPPGPERGKERSKTYQGIADAMAQQWGNFASGKLYRLHQGGDRR